VSSEQSKPIGEEPSVETGQVERPKRRRWRKALLMLGGGLGAGFVALQVVPYGWHHPNPPVHQDAPWPTPQAAALARRACYSCHSNETEWPLYARIAPASWLVRWDVEQGRAKLNFSEWGGGGGDAHDAADQLEAQSMPPSRYLFMHPSARLDANERSQLIEALKAMDDGSGSGGSDGSGSKGRGRGRGGSD
jgi:hypothetical protein